MHSYKLSLVILTMVYIVVSLGLCYWFVIRNIKLLLNETCGIEEDLKIVDRHRRRLKKIVKSSTVIPDIVYDENTNKLE